MDNKDKQEILEKIEKVIGDFMKYEEGNRITPFNMIGLKNVIFSTVLQDDKNQNKEPDKDSTVVK